MSVFYENHGRDGDHGAPPDASLRARWAAPRTPPRRRPDTAAASPLGLSYDRAEGVIQVVLAFALVAGATALLYSNLFSGPPAPAGAQTAAVTAATPAPAPVVAPIAALEPPTAPAPAMPESAPPAPPAPQATADAASLFDARPIAGGGADAEPAPQPLAPPSPEARQKLVVQNEPPAPPAEVAATEAEPAAAPASATAAESGRLTKCFLKIAGRVQENGSCRIRRSDREVVFEFSGKSLVLAHQRGRLWTATFGGRSYGKVYQTAHKPCWGARGAGFFACDNT